MQPLQRQYDSREIWKQPRALLDSLGLSRHAFRLAHETVLSFPMRVPAAFADRMVKGDPDDPLLRQVLPVAEEEYAQEGYSTDPLAEHAHQPVPGLLHKYSGRVLLVVTGACAIHCRYCFRRHFPYADANPLAGHWGEVMAYLKQDKSLSEIILSGGDPLTLDDAKLAVLVYQLAEIPHLERLRIHTRIPVVLPQRIGAGLVAWLRGTRLQPVMVVHANHAREIDTRVDRAIFRLRRAQVPVFNQSVLLKGVNDSVDALVDLSERLFAAGIIPYYLHMLDPVQGAAHFEVPEDRARQLMDGLRRRLPGYLVPRLVREQYGIASKIPL